MCCVCWCWGGVYVLCFGSYFGCDVCYGEQCVFCQVMLWFGCGYGLCGLIGQLFVCECFVVVFVYLLYEFGLIVEIVGIDDFFDCVVCL